MTRPPDCGQPVLRVVRGDASPEELAALVAVLVASRPAGGEARSRVRSASNSWSDRSRLLRRPPVPGPGAWRRSALPGLIPRRVTPPRRAPVVLFAGIMTEDLAFAEAWGNWGCPDPPHSSDPPR